MDKTTPAAHSLTMHPALIQIQRVKQFREEITQARNLGNQFGCTSAGLRLAVITCTPAKIEEYLLNEMGITSRVERTPDGVAISTRTHQSLTAIMRALRSAYNLAVAVCADGKQAVRVYV